MLMFKKILIAIAFSLSFSCVCIAQQNTNTYIPKASAYWAGWANAEIPNFKFNNLLLAFAILRKNSGGYWTSYSASGDFEKSSNRGAYVTWNNWATKWFKEGARAYVSYGGGTDDFIRPAIMNASNNTQLEQIAGEIKANIKKYYFGGVDLDVEGWWSYNHDQNIMFAKNLAKLVIILRHALDTDQDTRGKGIIVTVGFDSAGPVPGILPPTNFYTGTMLPFFQNKAVIAAIESIHIMSYNIRKPNFYARTDLIKDMLNTFTQAGVPADKLMVGVQPYEYAGYPPTSLATVNNLGKYIKDHKFGGMFLWGIGTNGIKTLSSWDYMNAMMQGLGLR